MSSRKNTRSKSHRLMVKNTSEKSKVAVKVKIENKTSYRCIECDNTYPRRFNAERHYKRFHEITQARRCCDEIFYTKSQYYDHKENVHNEKKKYGRSNPWKEENQSSDECNVAATNENCASNITLKTSIKIPKETDNIENVDSNSKEKYKNYTRQQSRESPLKIFIYRLQEKTNKNQNSAPLQSIENVTENSLNKTSRKNALKSTVKVNSNDKKNIIIYDCTATSVSNLMHIMSNTIDF